MSIPPLNGSGLGLGEFLELLRQGVNRSYDLQGDDYIQVSDFDGGRNLRFVPEGSASATPWPVWVVVQITEKDSGSQPDDDGNPTQWKYKGQVLQPVPNKNGYEGWEVMPSTGRRIVAPTVDIYNFREINNDGDGIQGNGINHDGSSYPANVKMIDLGVNEIYPALKVTKSKVDGSGEGTRVH